MKTLLNTTALAVILAGGALLAHPVSASATYYNPLLGSGGTSGGSDAGVSYCCRTGPTTFCCYTTGCATKEGTCVKVVPAS
jgi:hypothetical protein